MDDLLKVGKDEADFLHDDIRSLLELLQSRGWEIICQALRIDESQLLIQLVDVHPSEVVQVARKQAGITTLRKILGVPAIPGIFSLATPSMPAVLMARLESLLAAIERNEGDNTNG